MNWKEETAILCGEWTDAGEIQSVMRAQSQMGCREMEREEKSVRLKFSACAEKVQRWREMDSRWGGLMLWREEGNSAPNTLFRFFLSNIQEF